MSSKQNVHLVIRNTRPDDIEKIVKLQQESFPILARYGNIWHPEGITADGMFTNHNPNGDSLYGADISTHPKFRHEGIGSMLYGARKELVMRLALRRMISGGRLFNYCEYADRMSALEYAQKVITGELHDPVLSFQVHKDTF
jgi:hypothetical protein